MTFRLALKFRLALLCLLQLYSFCIIMSRKSNRQLPFSSIFKKYHYKGISELVLSPDDKTWIADLIITDGTKKTGSDTGVKYVRDFVLPLSKHL